MQGACQESLWLKATRDTVSLSSVLLQAFITACGRDWCGPEQLLSIILGWLPQKSGQVCNSGMRTRHMETITTFNLVQDPSQRRHFHLLDPSRAWQLPCALYPSALLTTDTLSLSPEVAREGTLFTHEDQSRLFLPCNRDTALFRVTVNLFLNNTR